MNAQKEKVMAETHAQMQLAVSQLNKQQAETLATQELECAKLDRMRAQEEAETQIILASAKEKSLKLGGAISERDRILAEIERDKCIGVAEQLAKISVPQFIISGGENSSTDVNGSLMNMILLRQLGVLPEGTQK